MNRAIRCSSTGSGTAPSARMASWKLALIELRTQRLLRFTTMPTDLQLAELVCYSLPGPGDVAIDFGGDLVRRQRDIVLHVLKRPIPRPTIVMNAGIDDEARRTLYVLNRQLSKPPRPPV